MGIVWKLCKKSVIGKRVGEMSDIRENRFEDTEGSSHKKHKKLFKVWSMKRLMTVVKTRGSVSSVAFDPSFYLTSDKMSMYCIR